MTFKKFSKALHDAANILGVQAPAIGTSKGKAYEAWIMLEIVVRLQKLGVIAFPVDHKDALVSKFEVSGGPANMPSEASSKGDEPCHFVLAKDRTILELHLGLKCLGLSDARHELDIVVIDRGAAKQLRQSGGGPYEGLIAAGAELKAYDRKHKLPHVIPRAMLGIAVDIDPGWIMGHFVIRTVGGKERQYTPTRRTYYSLMTSTRLHDSSAQYLEHHGAGAFSLVAPANCDDAIDAFVERIIEAMDR